MASCIKYSCNLYYLANPLIGFIRDRFTDCVYINKRKENNLNILNLMLIKKYIYLFNKYLTHIEKYVSNVYEINYTYIY